MLVIGNGTYLFRDKEGNVHKTTRGFNTREFPNLFEECQDLNMIPVINKRPLTWREVAYKLTFDNVDVSQDDVGVFIEEVKECNINMDCSRIWDGSLPTLQRCLQDFR